MSESIALSPATAPAGTQFTCTVTGTNTQFGNSGDYALSIIPNGTTATLVSVTVIDAAHATLTINPGNTPGVLIVQNLNTNDEFASAASITVTGAPYCTQSDIENIFGVSNVALWSNLDNTTTTANATRITAAITYATARINNYMRGGLYAVPLVVNSDAASVVDVAATIAGIWLYSSRGQLDTNALTGATYPSNRYNGILRAAFAKMLNWRLGLEQLDATISGIEATPATLSVVTVVQSLPGCL